MSVSAQYRAVAKRLCTQRLAPIPLPRNWLELLYAEQQSERDTLSDVMRRLSRRLREEDYEATTGLTVPPRRA